MNKPGVRLRAIARSVCSATTMERVVDPIIADLRIEYAEAIDSRRWFRASGILVSGYINLAAALLLQGSQSVLAWRDWTLEERRALGRTFSVAAVTAMVAAGVFILPPLGFFMRNALSWNARVVLLLIPQALPIAIPIGIAFGIFLGLRRGADAHRLTVAILLASLVCSAASFATFNRFVPVANQAFREEIFKDRPNRILGRGLNEMTLGELRRQMRGERIADYIDYQFDPKVAAVTYHLRWALSFAAVAFAVFALSVVRQRSLNRFAAVALGIAGAALYYVILDVGSGFGRDGSLPPIAGAWLANLVLLSIAAAAAFISVGKSLPPIHGEPTTS